MINTIAPNLFRFFGLIIIQVLVVNHLDLSYYINPYIYPLIILAFPLNTPHWALLLFAFFTGLTVDAFCNTAGIHAAASVFMAFLRPMVIAMLSSRGSYESTDQPTIRSLGFSWFLAYSAILLSAHHLFYFFLEVFNLTGFFTTLAKTIISAIFSISLVVMLSYLFSTAPTRR